MNIVWLKNKNLVEYDSTEKTQLILYKKEGSQFFYWQNLYDQN
jgi:hypothetical protein